MTIETGHIHPNYPLRVLTPVATLHIWVDLYHHTHGGGTCQEIGIALEWMLGTQHPVPSPGRGETAHLGDPLFLQIQLN